VTETFCRWFIQKPIRHNCPVGQFKSLENQGAVFQTFKPSAALKDHEWVEVVGIAAINAERARSAKVVYALKDLIEDHFSGCDCWHHRAVAEYEAETKEGAK
jgi:hypothetical protein